MSFFLKDRIKETSRSTGLGDFVLDGAAPGFSSFSEYYTNGDSFFYAITDGEDYEVGSGVYNVGASNTITRFPIQSTDSDSLVDFTAGVKEVFVTYPGKGAVFSAEGHDHNQQPADSGIAFYSTDQIVNYDRMLIWDSGKAALGIGQQSPVYAIDVGSDIDYSIVRASGFIDGGSGILFSGVLGSFSGGRQLEPFLRNVTNSETGSDAVIKLSGVVDQGILLHKQLPSTIFAGPLGSCGCVDDYPTFRLLDIDDLPLSEIDDRYIRQANVGLDGQSKNVGNGAFRAGSVALYSVSGYITYDSGIIYDAVNNRLLLRDHATLDDPRVTLDVDGEIYTTDIQASGYIRAKGNITTSGLISPSQGIEIPPYLPSPTTNMIYNDGGSLYWNGSPLTAPAYSFTVTDDVETPDTIANGETLTLSGVSGVEVRYAPNENFFRISASGLSGVLQKQINAFAGGTYGFSVTNGDFVADAIANAEVVTISGVSGIRVEYDPANNYFRVGSSGHHAALSNEFGLVSLSGVSGVAFYASGWIDNFEQAGGLLDATSGVARVDSNYTLDQYGSGILKRLSLFDDEAVILGGSGAHAAHGYQSGIFTGQNAGRFSYNSQCSINIGYDNSTYASGNESSITIGCEAGYHGLDVSRVIALGNSAIENASGVGDSIYIGNRSGAASSGVKTSLDLNNNIAIGNRSHEQSFRSARSNISLGNLSSRFSSYSTSGIYLGSSVNVDTSGIHNSVAIGSLAINGSKLGVDNISLGSSAHVLGYSTLNNIFIGQNAGYESSGTRGFSFLQNAIMGSNAGGESFDLSGCVVLGEFASFESESMELNTSIGSWAHRKGVNSHDNIFIGRRAGYLASGVFHEPRSFKSNISMGPYSTERAIDLSGCIAIGEFAGHRAKRSDNCIYIGSVAGSGRQDREGEIIFSNSDSVGITYQPSTGGGNGKNGTGWSLPTDSVFEMTTAFQGYINNLEDTPTRDVKFHMGHPLSASDQLKATLQVQRTDPSDYNLYLESDREADLTGLESDMAIADSPLKDTVAGEDGIPFVGPSGFLRIPWGVRSANGSEITYNGTNIPKIDGTIVGWIDSDSGPTNWGFAIGWFKNLNPMLGAGDGWVYHTGIKLP